MMHHTISRPHGPVASRGFHLAAGAAQQPAPKKKGAGTKMLDDMRKKGKPITPKLEEMALWLDSMDTSTLDDGQVSSIHNVCLIMCIGTIDSG